MLVFSRFQLVRDGPTDRQMDQRPNGRTKPLFELRSRNEKGEGDEDEERCKDKTIKKHYLAS